MDTIADFITRIRNASTAGHYKVDVPSSNIRKGIANILKEEGFIKNFKSVADSKQGMMRVYLKYTEAGRPVIQTIQRVSKPGLRRYVRSAEIPKVRSGYGVTVLSTSKGILTGTEAEKQKLGGEYLLKVW